MKRRSFLGFLGGAAVAGPSMAKEAVVGTMADLHLRGLGASEVYSGLASSGPAADPMGSELSYARDRLSKLLGRSAAELTRKRRNTAVHMLDADLACRRSFSLDFKIREQQRRNFEREIEHERSWLERRIAEIMEGE